MDIRLDREENGLDAVLTLNIKLEDIEGEATKKLKAQKQNLNIPGFRKGHVPVGIAKKYLWESVLKEELEKKLESEIDNYFKDNNLEIIRPVLPIINDKQIDLKTDTEYEFKYNIGIVSDFDLKYESIFEGLKKYHITVSQENIDKEVELIRDAYGEHSHPETIEKDENIKVYLNLYELDDEKNKLEEGIDEKVSKTITEIPEKLSELIIGRKSEEEFELDIQNTFSSKEEFAGFLNIEKLTAEDASNNFKLKVLSIHKHIKAEIDESLFEKFTQGKAKNKDDFYEEVENLLNRNYEKNANHLLQDEITENLIEKVDLRLPNSFLDKLFEEEYKERKDNMDEDQLSKERSEYDKKIKWSLISNRIAEENKIEVNEQEIVNEAYNFISSYYMQYGMQIQGEQLDNQVKEYLKNSSNIMYIRERISVNKVLEYLRENNEFPVEEIDIDSFQKIHDSKHNHNH